MLELIDNEKVINDAFEHLSNDKVMEFFINSLMLKIPHEKFTELTLLCYKTNKTLRNL